MAYEPDRNDKVIYEENDVCVYACSLTKVVSVCQDDEAAALTREEAISAARAILKHFEVE